MGPFTIQGSTLSAMLRQHHASMLAKLKVRLRSSQHVPHQKLSAPQAYEGLQTVAKLRQEYVFIPAKVKEVYLFHLLSQLQELSIRSAIIFASTCKVLIYDSVCNMFAVSHLLAPQQLPRCAATQKRLPPHRRVCNMSDNLPCRGRTCWGTCWRSWGCRWRRCTRTSTSAAASPPCTASSLVRTPPRADREEVAHGASSRPFADAVDFDTATNRGVRVWLPELCGPIVQTYGLFPSPARCLQAWCPYCWRRTSHPAVWTSPPWTWWSTSTCRLRPVTTSTASAEQPAQAEG